jgi:hypothetical protein
MLIAIGTFILNTIDEAILLRLSNSGKDFKYTDDIFESVKSIVIGSDYNLGYNIINKALTMQRSHYRTVE